MTDRIPTGVPTQGDCKCLAPGLMETSNTRRIGSYVSTTEVPDELRERATRMAVEARKDPQARVGAVKWVVLSLDLA